VVDRLCCCRRCPSLVLGPLGIRHRRRQSPADTESGIAGTLPQRPLESRECPSDRISTT
jgi:hypothetical protein